MLSSFAALQLKINQAQGYREARDAALEAFRSAQVQQLDGKLAARRRGGLSCARHQGPPPHRQLGRSRMRAPRVCMRSCMRRATLGDVEEL